MATTRQALVAGGLILASVGIPLLAFVVAGALELVVPAVPDVAVVSAVYAVAIAGGLIGSALLPHFETFPSISVEHRRAMRAPVAIYGGLLIIGWGLVVPFGNRNEPLTDRTVSVAVVVTVGAAVITPVVEEIWARGLIYRHLRTWLAPGVDSDLTTRRLVRICPAVLISAVVFALSHYLVASDVAQLLATVPVGVVLALAYEITGRLWVPIASHALLNAGVASDSLDTAHASRAAMLAVIVATLIAAFADRQD